MSCAKKCYWHIDHIKMKPFVQSEKLSGRFVTLDKLPGDKKRELWKQIQDKEPALAEIMQDETFLAFKKFFGAEQKMDQKQYNHLTKANDE